MKLEKKPSHESNEVKEFTFPVLQYEKTSSTSSKMTIQN